MLLYMASSAQSLTERRKPLFTGPSHASLLHQGHLCVTVRINPDGRSTTALTHTSPYSTPVGIRGRLFERPNEYDLAQIKVVFIFKPGQQIHPRSSKLLLLPATRSESLPRPRERPGPTNTRPNVSKLHSKGKALVASSA